MKFSYSQKLDKYVVTELGRLIDSDEDGIALGIRHGFVSDQAEDEEQESLLLDADDDNQLLHDFGALPDEDALDFSFACEAAWIDGVLVWPTEDDA